MTPPRLGLSSVTAMLRWRAEHQAEQEAFSFVADDGMPGAAETRLTYGELLRRAAMVALELRRRNARGERVLLIYPAGEHYVVAIYGCLLAGAVAVPAYPPRKNRRSSRIENIALDARPKLVLTTHALIDGLAGLENVDRVATDGGLPDDGLEWSGSDPDDDSLAVLQYTSGSTGQPRGVMVTDGNLRHNMRLIAHGFRLTADDRGMLWLPNYHDMGLIGGVLFPPYVGIPVALMPPGVFLQRPIRWLEAISRYRATISGGPNFGYDLCVARTTADDRMRLDLSSWRVAFVGAEPVRADTLDRFATAFAPSGFRQKAFYPCYGLAEATLIVSGGEGPAEPLVKSVSQHELARHRLVELPHASPAAKPIVGCGQAMPDTRVLVVDPDSNVVCAPGHVGEIWVAGPSIARGYWNRPDENDRVFDARLRDSDEGPFLRTGDLGALVDDELLVTGRLKDVLIVNGRNHYAQDIEWTAERSHDAVTGCAGAAFSVDVAGEERLVVVQEVKRSSVRGLVAEEVITAIRITIAREHDLPVHAVVLAKPLGVPKTSSGKTQRHACRDAYLSGTLESLGSWTSPVVQLQPAAGSRLAPARKTPAEIERWLIDHVARAVSVPESGIDVRQPFAYYGLSSLQAANLSGALEEWLGRSFPATIAYDYPTIASLSQHLADQPSCGNREAASGKQTPQGEVAAVSTEPIAIVGMACRFPGAPNLDAYWRLLTGGVDAVGDPPDDRRDAWLAYEEAATHSGKPFPRRAGFLGRIDEFDAEFFGITPREAASIDPQQRLLLEVASEALEDAALPNEALAGSKTGVFVGISSNDYSRTRRDDPERADPYAGTGNALSIAANRISYTFDFRGPSLALDTACSSALVALHTACQSLRAGQCDMALVGAVNLLVSPAVTASFAEMGFLSPDGCCKAFDASANGYVRGEGAGVVILKPLRRAIADDDRIYAIVRGSAVNSDGRTNGLTAPSRQAQEAVVRDAWASAGVAPARAHYVEAHGTGTPLGDPIEMAALGAVMGDGRDPQHACVVGSVKTNLGHLEAAAGIAGLMKTALALLHDEIPPSLHFDTPNPRIPFEQLPLVVSSARRAWPRDDGPRLAGVSSFGFGGTNAHVVLEEAPTRRAIGEGPSATGPAEPQLFVLSATSEERLDSVTRTFAGFLSSTKESWEDICYTTTARTRRHDHRRAVVASAAAEASARLNAVLSGDESGAVRSGLVAGRGRADEGLVFVFTGQGAQWPGMARDLLAGDAVFRSAIEACDAVLRRDASFSVLDALASNDRSSRLADTSVAQPAIVALQIGLAACWRHWGVRPAAVVGHSVGEIAAAHVAGVLTLDDALRLAFHRGRIMQRSAGRGRMAAVRASPSEVEAALGSNAPSVSVAAVNSSLQVVLSGDAGAIERALASLRDRGLYCRELPGEYAFHSAQMEPLARELADALRDFELPRALHASSMPVIATAEGWKPDVPAFRAEYWPHQMRHAVRFADAIRRLTGDGYSSFLELGPQSVLTGAVTQCLRDADIDGIAVSTLQHGVPARASMLGALGALHCRGHSFDWRALRPSGGRPVALPKHPWRRQRYWNDDAGQPVVPMGRGAHPLLGERLHSAAAATHVWQNQIDGRRQPFLQDHRFQGGALVPGTAYFEVAVAAAFEAFGAPATALVLKDIEFRAPLFLPRDGEDAGARITQVVLTQTSPEEATFRVFSRPSQQHDAASWTLHATGNIARDRDAEGAVATSVVDLGVIQSRCEQELSGEEYFAELAGRGFEYGPAFRGLNRLWRRPGAESFGRLEIPDVLAAEVSAYHLHPALLDAGAQLLVATDGAPDRPFLPAGVDMVRVRPRSNGGQPRWGHARHREASSNGSRHGPGFVGDVRLLDGEGNLLVEALGLRVRYVDQDDQSRDRSPERWLYDLRWEKKTRSPDPHDGMRLEGTWLILADASGVGEVLSRRIARLGGRCVLVFAGDEVRSLGEDRYHVRAANEDDARYLAERVTPFPRGIIHLWSLDAAPPDALNVAALTAADRLGCRTVVSLARAFGLHDAKEPCAVWLVTRGVQRIDDADKSIAVSQAALWGLGRTLFQEQAAQAGGLIDLDPAAASENVVSFILDAVAAPDGETQLAIRRGERYVARLTRAPELDGDRSVQFRADASYLITGGLGALGLAVANWMLDHGGRRLILLGRTQLPPRVHWTSVDRGSRAADAVAAVRALEARGASVHLASVDVSDDVGLGEFIAGFKREGWPAIRGVVHAAGVLHDAVLSQVSPAALEAVTRAKVLGGWLLHRQFADEGLDFFVLFSSAASLLGSAGQGPYAAANAFLDALAHLRRGCGTPALSVNWGPWDGVGMAADPGVAQGLARRGIGSIRPADGLNVLGRLMGSTRAQVAVVPIDWHALGRAIPAARTAPLFMSLNEDLNSGDSAASLAFRDQILTVPPEHRQALAERLVRDEVARVARLEPERIDPDRSLDALGIDSLMSIELKNRLERRLGTDVAIPVVRLLEVPTVRGLAAVVLDEAVHGAQARPATKANGGSAATAAMPIVALRETGAESPLFLVHPGALDVQVYRELADHLGDDQPCYVLQPPELEPSRLWADGAPSLDVSIETVATSCVDALRGVQPRGPYRLGGWSLGGVVAFDIALQLEAQGETVSLVALFDAPSPTSGERPTDWDDAALVRLFGSYLGARHGRQLTLPPDDTRIAGSDDHFRRLRDQALVEAVLPVDAEIDHVRALYETYKDGLRLGTQLLWRYRPRIYGGALTYFRAEEESSVLTEVFPAAAATWAGLTSSSLVIHDVPGSHYTMLLSPHASTLARSLKACL